MSQSNDMTSGGEKPQSQILPTGMDPTVREILTRRGKRLLNELETPTGKAKPTHQSLLTAYGDVSKRQKLPDKVPMDKGSAKTKGGVPKQVSKAATKRTIQEVSTTHDMELLDGFSFSGKWTEKGQASGPRPKVADRDLQMLNQLSTLVYEAVYAATGTQEIEAMAVKGCLVISANEEDTVAAIQKVKLSEVLSKANSDKLGDVASALRAKSGSDLSEREKSGMGRLASLETDTARFPGQVESVQTILETVHKAMAEKTAIIDGGSPQKVAGLINSGGAKGRVVTVNAWDGPSMSCSHAEQNLLYALVLSGYQGKASIAGKKRPCTVCWISLMLVRKAGYDITFNIHPGGFWDGTTYQGLQRIAAVLGFTDETSLAPQVRALAGEDSDFQQYVTDVLGKGSGTSPVRLLDALKKGSQYKTEISTPDRSPTYDFPPTPPRTPPTPGILIRYAGPVAGIKTPPEAPGPRELTLTKAEKTIGTDLDDDIILGNGTTSAHAADVWLDGTQAKLRLLNATGTTVTRGGKQDPGATGTVYVLASGDKFGIGPYTWEVK